jgi:quercetin dioxygenase-like cupin family protein
VAAGSGIRAHFAETGYYGPARVLSPAECRRFLDAAGARRQAPLDWHKGAAATSRTYFELAALPSIVDVVAELLDDAVLLWGATLVERAPDEVHHWHTDIESAAPDARTVSVWLGLENTTPLSSLRVLSRSHRFGVSLQEVRHANARGRVEATSENVVRWAHERDPRAELVEPAMSDGDALFFDGRLWHGTHNLCGRTRRALLLQYAAPETAIRIADLDRLDWPHRLLDSPRPPCLVVRGRAPAGANRLVPAPAPNGGPALASGVHRLRLPLPGPGASGWQTHPAFSGSTADLAEVSCHASVLAPGHTPHPPHAHDEEELLLVLAGEVELLFAQDAGEPLRAGELVYYPAGFVHTLRAAGSGPATYVMFKWRAQPAADGGQLPRGRFETTQPGLLFEGATRYLRKLQAHVTLLRPGEGYEPHADAYDVGLVVLEGEVETIGGRAASHDVVFYRAGEPHGMRCVSDAPARYVVFEFHGRRWLGSRPPFAAHARRQLRTLLRRARRRLAGPR